MFVRKSYFSADSELVDEDGTGHQGKYFKYTNLLQDHIESRAIWLSLLKTKVRATVLSTRTTCGVSR